MAQLDGRFELLSVPLSGRHLDASGIVADMELSSVIRSALAMLALAANTRHSPVAL